MKCTSRVLAVILLFTLLSGLFAGCGKEELSYAYDLDGEVSSFRIVTENSSDVAESFASNLCVVTEDISGNGIAIDMSQATSAGLFDLNHNEVLYAKNIHERLHPASLTKVMTALVALKYGNPDDKIVVSSNVNITESGATLCGLQEGDQLTLNQALHALLLKSANDAGVAVAEHISGSVEEFAELMNEEALAIGATNSHFVNPHGLTEDNHYVTAYDMYLIFQEALKYELFSEIIHMSSYNTVYMDRNGSEKSFSFTTTNWYLNGTETAPEKVTVIGGKTGTTNAAGNCLVLLSRDTSGNPYISVILQSKERAIMYDEMSELLEQIQ